MSRSWSSFWHDFCDLQPIQGAARASGVSQVFVREGNAGGSLYHQVLQCEPDWPTDERSHGCDSGDGLRLFSDDHDRIRDSPTVVGAAEAFSIARTNSPAPVPHFENTLIAVVSGRSTGCTLSGGKM
jgi:hypothetical protein